MERIKLRRGSESEWANKNPVLDLGEPGYNTTFNRLKIGNGINRWSDLDYLESDVIGGPDSYTHTQSSPASTWTINHDLGFYPNVLITDLGGLQMLGEISQVSVNQVVVYFDSPITGKAIIS